MLLALNKELLHRENYSWFIGEYTVSKKHLVYSISSVLQICATSCIFKECKKFKNTIIKLSSVHCPSFSVKNV